MEARKKPILHHLSYFLAFYYKRDKKRSIHKADSPKELPTSENS